MKKNDFFIVLNADNVSTDINEFGVFAERQEAQKTLTEVYKDCLACFDKCEIESTKKTTSRYEILLYNGDFYYGTIKCFPFPKAKEKTRTANTCV